MTVEMNESVSEVPEANSNIAGQKQEHTCDADHALQQTRDESRSASLVEGSASPAGFATDVANLQTEYRALNTSIEDLTTQLLAEHRRLQDRLDTELIPMLDRMQRVLSKRGELHALVVAEGFVTPALTDLEDVPTWTDWFETFRERINLSLSLRSVQRRLAKLRGNVPPPLLTPEEQQVVQALLAQGYLKGEATKLAKAATGATFQERFKSALASRVSPATAARESNDEDSTEHVQDSHEPQPPIECGDLTPEPGTVEESRQVAEGGSVSHTASSLNEDETDNPTDSAGSASVRGDVAHSRLIRPAPGAISEQLAASAIDLAKAIIEGGFGGKFPGALDLLQDANVPVPSIAPGPGPEQVCWRDVLTHLMDKMEQYGDRLPVAVTTEMRGIRKLLVERTPTQTTDPQGTLAVGKKATRGYRVKEKKKTDTAGVHYAVARDGDKEPYGYYGTRQEADSVCESLNSSPVSSIGDAA